MADKRKIWWIANDIAEAARWFQNFAPKGVAFLKVEAEKDSPRLDVVFELEKDKAEEILGYLPGEEEWLQEDDAAEETPAEKTTVVTHPCGTVGKSLAGLECFSNGENDQPMTCPQCGSRTDFDENVSVAGCVAPQYHICPNGTCKYEFILAFDEDVEVEERPWRVNIPATLCFTVMSDNKAELRKELTEKALSDGIPAIEISAVSLFKEYPVKAAAIWAPGIFNDINAVQIDIEEAEE